MGKKSKSKSKSNSNSNSSSSTLASDNTPATAPVVSPIVSPVVVPTLENQNAKKRKQQSKEPIVGNIGAPATEAPMTKKAKIETLKNTTAGHKSVDAGDKAPSAKHFPIKPIPAKHVSAKVAQAKSVPNITAVTKAAPAKAAPNKVNPIGKPIRVKPTETKIVKSEIENISSVDTNSEMDASDAEYNNASYEDDEDDYPSNMDPKLLTLLTKHSEVISDISEQKEQDLLMATLKVDAKFRPLLMSEYIKRKEVIDQIPMFWPLTLGTHELTEAMIAEEDFPLLSRLINIDVTYMDVKTDAHTVAGTGYTIKLTFADNEYLTANDIVVNVTATTPDQVSIKVQPISWAKGKNFTQTPPSPSQKNKASKKRPVDEPTEYSGFFSFFNIPTEDGAEDFFNALAHDIYPNAVDLFLASQFGDSDSEDDGSDSDDNESADDMEA